MAATELEHLQRDVQVAHPVQVVVDHELQDVGHMRLVRVEVLAEDGAALEQIGGAAHEARIEHVDLEELMLRAMVAVEGSANGIAIV